MKPSRTKHFLLASILLATSLFTNCQKKGMPGGLDYNSLKVTDAKVVQTFKTAKENNKKVLLIFDAVWCGYCRKFNQITMKDAEVKKTLADFEILNIDVDKFPEVVSAFKNIKSVPTMMIFSPEGIQTDETGGYVKAEKFNRILKKNL